MTVEKKTKTRNVVTYLVSFFASFIGILLNLFLARALEAAVYGRIQYFVALATTCSSFLLFGLNSFLVREANNPDQNGQASNKCFTLYLAIAAALLPLMFLVLYFLVPQSSFDLLVSLLVLGAAFFIGASSLISAHFQGWGKYHMSVILENLIPKLVLLALSVSLAFAGAKPFLGEYYFIFYVVVYALVVIPCFCVLFKRLNLRFTKKEIKTILFFFGVTVTYSVGNNLTKVLQGAVYQNDVALAIISVSLSIVSLVRVFTSVMDNIVKPIFAKQKRENDLEGLLQTYRFDTRMNCYVAIPLYLFFIFNNAKFLSFFGESYLTYPTILSLVATANFVCDLTGPNGTMLAMIGKEKWELFNGLLYFAVFIGCVFLFSFDPIYGLSVSLLIAQASVNLAKYIEVWVLFKKTPLDWKSLVTIALIGSVDFLAIFFLRLIPGFWLWFGIGVAVGITLVGLNCFVLSLYRGTDFKRLLAIRL